MTPSEIAAKIIAPLRRAGTAGWVPANDIQCDVAEREIVAALKKAAEDGYEEARNLTYED